MTDERARPSGGLKTWIIWLAGSLIAVAIALSGWRASFIDGHYVPVGNDSFYHARRILDLLADASSLHEFDRFIHYPEGSLLIWPWGYDFFMSLLVRAGLALHLGKDAITVLVHIPVIAFPACIALIIAICRQLRLSLAGTTVAVLATALFPLNSGLYGVGNIDHHFAEQLVVLGSLALGLRWLGDTASAWRAAATGACMGLALCLHNGLFIVQLPIVALFLWAWIRGLPLPRTTWAFALALVVGTVLAAAPSTAFREGAFHFYELSWFHIYFAACASATCVFVSRYPRNMRYVGILVVAILAMLVPVISQLLLADRFLSVSVEGAEQIAEVQSLWELAGKNGLMQVAKDYSYLVLALPFAVGLCAHRIWFERNTQRLYFWLASLMGLALLALMVRMHVFGSFALVLVWIVFLEELVASGDLTRQLSRSTLALIGLAACAAFVPSLFKTRITANDPYYALTYDVYPELQRECDRAPGVALANLDDGNYIRYHTNCQIIANNFLLTAFHESKVRETRALLSSPARELAQKAPFVRYVFVHRQSMWSIGPDGRMRFSPAGSPDTPDPRLVSELLTLDAGDLPPHFRLVKELAFEKPQHVVYGRLFAIDP